MLSDASSTRALLHFALRIYLRRFTCWLLPIGFLPVKRAAAGRRKEYYSPRDDIALDIPRQILRRVKMGVRELHHKRCERAAVCHCSNSPRGRFLSLANIFLQRRASLDKRASTTMGKVNHAIVPILIYITHHNAAFVSRAIYTVTFVGDEI